MTTWLPQFTRYLTNWQLWAYGLFWTWNPIFLAFMFLGFGPLVLIEMVNATRAGLIPTAFLAYALLMTLIPAIAVVLGLTLLRRTPDKLFTLGYGVEGPLMLLLAIRFFAVRELTPPITLILTITALGLATLLWQLLDRRIEQRSPTLAHLRLVGLTLLLLMGLYASLWLAFYVLPIGLEILKELGRLLQRPWYFDWRDLAALQWLPFWLLGTVLMAYTATLFVLMPLAVPLLYLRAWWQGARTLSLNDGWSRPALLTVGVLAAVLLALNLTAQQPQHEAFALLRQPPASLAQAQQLLTQEATIRDGLLNAYLAPQRYFSAVGEVEHVQEMYSWSVGLPEAQAEQIQGWYEVVARPVLYEPTGVEAAAPATEDQQRRGDFASDSALRREPEEAARLYETFFDQTILEGERAAIVHAARSTWSIDQAQTAWQAVDDREVHLLRQEVSVSEQGDWAEVELYEVYQNQTGQRQEVVYYFSLPESAVITGVWLGNSADRSQRFAYRVSPRGAAQSLYRNEVRQNRDPALVEQLGPRQYRLRVFPIEPRSLSWESRSSTVQEGPPMHLWLTWRVLASDNGWPLPHLAERRNVYWDDASVRQINGQPMQVADDQWLPASIPLSSPAKPVARRVAFPSGESVIIRPIADNEFPTTVSQLRLAVVLDRSRSMVKHEAEVRAALTQLRVAMEGGQPVDLYLTASQYRGEAASQLSLDALDPASIVYYGGQNAAELLAQFEALRAGRDYDAILVLTDGSGYELGASEITVPMPQSPVWMVHLAGDFPLGYDDATLEAIQASGGGVVGAIDEALTRLLVAHASGQAASTGIVRDVIDGYLWQTLPPGVAISASGETVTVPPSDAFAAFAARRLILAAMQRQSGQLGQVETLDHLHAIAIEHSIVTPYSSMIVLVNEVQQKMLDELEKRDDRFEREFEALGETTPEDPLNVTGVPEPEEWLLLTLGGAMLIWYMRRSRQTASSQ
jgi:putative PEP-CTERM system integral membrane protein